MEAGSDVQKYLFKTKTGGDKSKICDVGFFKWSRHPNYFGEIIIQFGTCEADPRTHDGRSGSDIARLQFTDAPRSYLHDRSNTCRGSRLRS